MAIVLDDSATESHLRELATAAGVSPETALKLCVSATVKLSANDWKPSPEADLAERRRRSLEIIERTSRRLQGTESADVNGIIAYDKRGLPT
jgi:hypothetical protein